MSPAAVDSSSRSRRRRTWQMIAISFVGIAVVIIGTLMISGSSRAASSQQRLDAIVDQLDVPADWVLVEENRRRPGFAGTCLIGVFDARSCSKVSLQYALPETPTRISQIKQVFPRYVWSSTLGECDDYPTDASGSRGLCALETHQGDHGVRIYIVANVSSGLASSPTAQIFVSLENP
jgi:hypothetical protein